MNWAGHVVLSICFCHILSLSARVDARWYWWIQTSLCISFCPQQFSILS